MGIEEVTGSICEEDRTFMRFIGEDRVSSTERDRGVAGALCCTAAGEAVTSSSRGHIRLGARDCLCVDILLTGPILLSEASDTVSARVAACITA